MIRLFSPRIEEIHVEKKGKLSNNINISLNTDKIEEKEGFLEIGYSFIVKYGDNKIELKGIIFGKGNEEELKKLLEYWKENQKAREDLFVILYNFLMTTLFPKLVILADMVGLPAPVRLPLIREEHLNKNREKNEEEYLEDIE
jgi:hypothetical protein